MQWRPFLPKGGGFIQEDFGGHPPCPTDSKQFFGNLQWQCCSDISTGRNLDLILGAQGEPSSLIDINERKCTKIVKYRVKD